MKPANHETKDVHMVAIPGPANVPCLALRFFDGGLKDQKLWAFDYYDYKNGRPVNQPDGYFIEILPMPASVSLMCAGRVTSWEAGMGMKDIPPGTEKFNVPEGVICGINVPGSRRAFYFEAPKRPLQVTEPIHPTMPAKDFFAQHK
jgi:hypothetical protein